MTFTAIAITLMIAAFNINMVGNNPSDISLHNIEVLSFGESGGLGCLGTGSVECINGVKARIVW